MGQKNSRSWFLLIVFIAAIPFLSIAASTSAGASTVLMISVDGMKPEYVLQADAHGLKVPFLRNLVKTGTFADGVTGVWPTVTYPSHTTLLTGVTPAEHGIYNNLEYDPRSLFAGAWSWYARQIKVPTLWQAAHEAGIITASVGWPVSVGATQVDYLIPEYWRLTHRSSDLDPSDADLIAALTRPDDMLPQMQSRLGAYMLGNDPSRGGDEIKTRFAVDIIRMHKPGFMTIHLSSLDATEHEHGPFSAEADDNMEAIDGWLATLFAASQTNDPAAVMLVVSDHGFMSITHRVNLLPPLERAGASQSAHIWPAGGMAAVVFDQPTNDDLQQKVAAAFQAAAADPHNGIAAVLGRDDIRQRGAFPNASLLIVMQPGYYVQSESTAGATEMVADIKGTPGSHGFSPAYPEMRASFFMAGAGIARHKDLGLIDMRQIAPTVARILDVQLPSSQAAPLAVRR